MVEIAIDLQATYIAMIIEIDSHYHIITSMKRIYRYIITRRD